MSNAAIDANSKQTITARLKTDNTVVTRLTAEPTTQALSTTLITAGAESPTDFSGTDDNGRTTWFAVSEDDPTQLVALQCDSTGALLIKIV